MKIIAVLAMTEERLIGKDGQLPWHIPEDLKHFQELTKGKIVIMGKNTYYSLPEKYRPLPHRRNIVLTRGDFSQCEHYASIKELIETLKNEKVKEAYIIGGTQIYQAFFEAGLVDVVECTLIEGDYSGDAYLPEWRDNFVLESEREFDYGIFQRYTHIHPKIQENLRYILSKGFIISDTKKVVGYLEKVGMHRLRRYFNTVASYEGTDFQRIIDAYVFDKRLRNICNDSIEIIEKSLKNLIVLYIDDYKDRKIYINSGEQYDQEKEQEKYEKRLDFIDKKLTELLEKDIECREYHLKHGNLLSELFFDNLSFGETLYFYEDFSIDIQIKISNYYCISHKVLLGWFKSLLIIRNLSSHSRNISNKKYTALKGNFHNTFGKGNNSTFISRIFVIYYFMERLCPEYCFIEKIYNLLEKYKFTLNDFCDKKETPHIELESEAWEVIVEPLYGKIIHKSRK